MTAQRAHLTRTAGPPTYEGRRLPRPQDELVDQGLRFDTERTPSEDATAETTGPTA